MALPRSGRTRTIRSTLPSRSTRIRDPSSPLTTSASLIAHGTQPRSPVSKVLQLVKSPDWYPPRRTARCLLRFPTRLARPCPADHTAPPHAPQIKELLQGHTLAFGIVVTGFDPGLDRRPGEVAGVGQVVIEFGLDDLEAVDPAVAQHALVILVRPYRAVGRKLGVDALDELDHSVDLVEELLVQLDPARVLELHHPVDDIGQRLRDRGFHREQLDRDQFPVDIGVVLLAGLQEVDG